MIAGIGVDIVELERIRQIHNRYGEKFARRILDDHELAEYRKATSKERLLAKRFAAKEAASKALGTGFSNGITLNMIGVRHDSNGRPLLELSSDAAAYAGKLGVARRWLSISDEKNYSIAMVVLESVSD
ncbi:MAG: holo-ACP synthase [Thiotrichales bacterium]|nr:MAG: holo-ACP synthase [Thiotrichales bacterium]